MNQTTRDLFSFIEASPTSFHAVENTRLQLEKNGFTRLMESQTWNLTPGQGYYVTRNQSSLIAFRVPAQFEGFIVGAAHTDSPALKLKENMTLHAEGFTKLDAERYGGMLLSTWFDRPLSIAGRLLISTEKGTKSVLVNINQDLLVIPSLAIHMDRSANDGRKLDMQIDLLPLLGKGEQDLIGMLAENAGVDPKDILSQDLFIYNRDRGTVLGPDGELILSPRLDDLQCVFGLLEGFLRAQTPQSLPVLCLFDNEEVGSQTRQGAMSTFLYDVLQRVCIARGMNEEAFYRCVAQSLMVSADNAHAVHPNHPEKAAMTNRPRMGDGVVIKYGARYATDGSTAALLRRLLIETGIKTQTYFNHSNIPGGGTLGNISETKVSMHTVDVGLPQLAMHSACETAGASDTDDFIRAMEACFSAKFTEIGPETYDLTIGNSVCCKRK